MELERLPASIFQNSLRQNNDRSEDLSSDIASTDYRENIRIASANMDTNMEGVHTNVQPESNFQHHTLRLVYPAVELLPPGRDPFIELPKGVGDREDPWGNVNILGLSAGNLDFFVRFRTDHGITDNDAIRDGERTTLEQRHPTVNLPDAIARLSTFAGVSNLKIVTYIADDFPLTEFTRLQLNTLYYTNFGKIDEYKKEFEMATAELKQMLRTLRKTEDWARLLDDLVYSKSDRAWCYTSSLLSDWNEVWLDGEEESWGIEWDEKPFRNTRQLFADRLVELTQNIEGKLIEDDIGDIDERKDEELQVRLPCGHIAVLPPNYIQNMSLREAWTTECKACDMRILNKEDDQTLAYYFDHLKRTRWDNAHAEWVAKSKRVRNDSTLVEIPSVTLKDSLYKALATFELPNTVNPPLLCPTRYPESEKLLTMLAEKLSANPTIPAMTPKALFTNLEKLAWTLVEEIVGDATLLNVFLPPGFDEFVARWITRAVNDAVGTKADDEQDADLMAVMEKMTKTKIDPREAKTEQDLDDVLTMIGKASLEAVNED